MYGFRWSCATGGKGRLGFGFSDRTWFWGVMVVVTFAVGIFCVGIRCL